MKTTLHERLLYRSIGDRPQRKTKVRDFYGDGTWIDDLDIINELGAHTGCVNALSWSRSGRFLASGSDDTHLNIWSYNPDSLAKPFSLSTSIATGHGANIFGVKFAPHSNDRTVITCAGDSQVRVFDVEYGGKLDNPSREARQSDSTSSRRVQNFFTGARFLNVGNTNAKVYRSHGERVKRIVTESSPYTFLTCSEDGEVRQWDLRQPSSAYPAPRGGQGFSNLRPGHHYDTENVPPPLISYKKYSLDLNTISCSINQPHYIALAGAHLHCFLHDRRMLGRDRMAERGETSTSTPKLGSHEDTMMDQATRCVRRFAPKTHFTMGIHENAHITGCKISDANPNELIASWSGDHIYSFDIVQSPDVRDASSQKNKTLRQSYEAARRREDLRRKRKRTQAAGSANTTEHSNISKRRVQDGDGDMSLIVRYGNGQNEIVAIQETDTHYGEGPNSLLTEAQKLSQRIGRSLVQLRKSVFDFGASVQETAAEAAAVVDSTAPSPYASAFTQVLGQAAVLLPQIDDVIRDWSYLLDPSPDEVRLQKTLRRNRQASWRFVQASGCMAAAMGGRLQTLSAIPDTRASMFRQIEPARREGPDIPDNQRFCYDFLKAILLWLTSGPTAVVEAFCRQPEWFKDSPRFPLQPGDGPEAIDNKLIPYLMDLARDDQPILNLDANRFETIESRTIFASQAAAVTAFCRAFNGFRASDGSGGAAPESPSQCFGSDAARRFWGVKVGRSLLMEAGEGINYDFVSRAFGGLRVDNDEESPIDQGQEVGNQSDRSGEAPVDVIRASDATMERAPDVSTEPYQGSADMSVQREIAVRTDSIPAARAVVPTDHSQGDQVPPDEHDDDDDDDHDGVADGSASEIEESDDDTSASIPLFRRRMGFGGAKERARVEFDKPFSSHTRVYKGNANVQTVKDCGFSGLNDEYVVSGSDCGHVFIWDRKTTKLVNILRGDGEVVNVVESHPEEPMLAVSGIDSTIKIFSPDARLQHEARRGINVVSPPDSTSSRHSSLRFGTIRRPAQSTPPAQESDGGGDDANDDDVGGSNSNTVSPGGLSTKRVMHRSREIMSQNDVQRRDGVSEALTTRGMLARLAAHLHAQGFNRNGTGDGTGDDDSNGDGNGNGNGNGNGDGPDPVVLDDQCVTM